MVGLRRLVMSKKLYSVLDIADELSMDFNEVRTYARFFSEFLDLKNDAELLSSITLADKQRLNYLICDYKMSGKEIREYIAELKSDEHRCVLLRNLSEEKATEENITINDYFERVMKYLWSIDNRLEMFEGVLKEVGILLADRY